jgi:hypothetical protein
MFNSVSSEVDLLCKQMTIPCRHRRKTAVSLFEKDRRSMKEKVLKFRDPYLSHCMPVQMLFHVALT